jgi:hypothetical protein
VFAVTDANPDQARAHWCKLYQGLHESPQEFYEQVSSAVAKLKIPDAIVERVEYREGGIFSGFRQYLRVRRHREAFDVCGAPFGDGFFFSWWLADLKPSLPPLLKMLIVFGYLAILGTFVQEFGMFRGPLILICLLPLGLWMASHLGTAAADDFILSLPWIGTAYERIFRPITYYRLDTSHMFQQAVESAVMEVVQSVTAAKGLRGLTELERKPVMRDFFKR